MQAKFDRLLLSLVRFVKLRIDGDSARFPYLRRIVQGSPPGEVELQDDLWEFLTTSDHPEAERKQVSAGRVDIWIPQGAFRFVIEVKRLLGRWVEPTLQPLLRQTTPISRRTSGLGCWRFWISVIGLRASRTLISASRCAIALERQATCVLP